MTVLKTSRETADAAAPGYAAYAQLVRMLLPSSGCLAIYAVDGDLGWCSDGFERPDFRELVDEFRSREQGVGANRGTIRKTTAGVSALVARLADEAGATLGYVLIELGRAHSGAGSSMAASLTRPLFACLAAQLALERPDAAAGPRTEAKEPKRPVDARMDFLLGIGEIDLTSPAAIRRLLKRSVDHLDCVSAVFCIPDQDLTEIAERATLADDATRARLDATRKNLLAWVQLNNRPMVVNRIESGKAPYKILSCPVVNRDGKANGLLALFRAAEGADFEQDDIRLAEFVSKQAMALLYERQDALTGLMSRPAFERHLEQRDSRAPTGMLLYIDVEALKAINEQFGFRAGDEVILRTAQLIRRALMPTEFACRLAADRFVIHLPERDESGAGTLGAEIVKSARDLGYKARDQRVPLELRYGVSAPPAESTAARHWIAAAELACQRTRTAGSTSPYNGSEYSEARRGHR